jgi:hypothetical protein
MLGSASQSVGPRIPRNTMPPQPAAITWNDTRFSLTVG